MGTGTATKTVRRLKIREWPESDRPREKLLRHGPEGLGDAELVAILLGSGTRNLTAVDVAQQLLGKYGSLGALASAGVREFVGKMGRKGVGPARGARLAAAFEIGRRVQSEGVPRGIRVRTPEDIQRRFGPGMRDLPREVFKVVLLDGANRILQDVTVSQGILNASVVAPREVFKPAVDHRAAGIVLLHNHPSGESSPSPEDRRVTQQLAMAGKVMGIPVVDHIIVARDGYFSFAKAGYLKIEP